MEEDRDIMNGYPWPPRSYTCTFCKREFKSAQALGGHMNVHRKDRARLRCPPQTDCLSQLTHSTLLNLNLNPKPNPNPNLISSPPPPPPSATPLSSVSARQLPPLTTSSTPVPSWISPPSHSPFPLFSSPSATCHGENMKWIVGGTFLGPCFNLKTLDLCTQMKIKTKSQEDGCMRLDLENGVLRGDSEEDIDLELRLGKYK